MLVDGPCKFIVQLPSDDHHQQRAHRYDNGDDNQEGFGFPPHIFIDGVVDGQHADGFLDLLDLHGAIDQKTDVADAQPDDLNGVFQTEGVVGEHDFVDETETIQREETGDGLGGGDILRFGVELELEVCEDITAYNGNE